ncbi:unnamed protein product [Medioppia subpectinata]|uniref:SCP domain-containing protein n=1 Tax=Medioppia subpectinata TaxID=1979941 RepID=A0A7R9PZM7_9ACAR|nr:unnamed protein product [Medioppia subpectinata]CAG2107120.1 unnamed protein product [Medioppia subpectinata]
MTVVVVFMIYITICFARNSMPDRTDDNFQNDCLKTSNDLRARHHAPGFHLDHDAVNYAKSRCQLISQYEGLSHGHAGLKGYGENLYWGGNSADVTVSKYDYDHTGFSSATGHFTQLVWKGTTGVGCARCAGRGGQWFETYVVCSYKPQDYISAIIFGNY